MVSRSRLVEVLGGFSSARVVLYGDLVLDRFILGTPKRISREAPVIILRYEDEHNIPGGAGNALANLAALGVTVRVVGAVGDDEPGAVLLGLLEKLGIDTSTVVRVPGFRTPMKVRLLGGGACSLKHQMARYDVEDHLPADAPFRQQLHDHLEATTAGAGALAVSDYGYGTVEPEAVAAVCEAAGRTGWVCLDSRYRLGELRGVDGATPNLGELEDWAGRTLTGDGDVASAAEALRAWLGARFILATRGNRGMTLVEEGRGAVHIPVWGGDQVADVTGAGDTVIAVLTAALAAGARPHEAAVLANYGGGIVVMKLGTATVSREELRTAVLSDPGLGS
ncbi:MAG: sugar kinase [Acidobacteria bacterium]|nr:sugar kinase [Acidobacteriota bacterium]